MREEAPLAPPYEAWLKKGKVVWDFVVDGDANSIDHMTSYLAGIGFARVGKSEPPIFRKTVGEGDKKAVVEIRLRQNDASIFQNAGNKDVDIIMYSGHSDLGRNVPRSLANAPAGDTSNQLFVFETCFGKDNLSQVRRKLQGAQVLTTFESSTEWHMEKVIDGLLDGIGGRKPWTAIREHMGAVTESNWVTPIESMLRRRLMDRDGDGRADIFDRLFDVDLTRVPESLDAAFTPHDPGAPLHKLQALPGVTTASWLNRGIGAYNEAWHALNPRAAVICAGFFAAGPKDPPVRITQGPLIDGARTWQLWLNPSFAQMPEEALRAVAVLELMRWLCDNEPSYAFYKKPRESAVNALMAVSHTLTYDFADDDEIVWQKALAAYGMPSGIDLSTIEDWAGRNGAHDADVDAGSLENVQAYLEDLQKTAPTVYAALGAADVGRFR
jgi:hypothetical protein